MRYLLVALTLLTAFVLATACTPTRLNTRTYDPQRGYGYGNFSDGRTFIISKDQTPTDTEYVEEAIKEMGIICPCPAPQWLGSIWYVETYN